MSDRARQRVGGETTRSTGKAGNAISAASAAHVIFKGVALVDPRVGCAVGDYGAICTTRDGGAIWMIQASPIGGQLNAVRFAFGSHTGWAVGNYGIILHTQDAGQTWQAQSSGRQIDLLAVAAADPQTAWVVGNYGLILHTEDGGQTWTPQASGTEVQLKGVAFVDQRRGWIVGNYGLILATEDGGRTWTPQAIEQVRSPLHVSS